LLTFNNGATTPGSTNTSFVDGPVRKVFNAAESFTFPIGVTGTGDEPLGISGAALNNDFTAQYLRSSATALGGVISPILNVSRCDQWTLTKNSAPAASVSVTLSWDANSPCNAANFVTNPATLTIGHFNGSMWDQAGTSGSFTGTATAGTVTRNNVTAFSPFSLANTTENQNPLPVTFGNLKGYAKNAGIQIDWTIYNESNVDHYEIERSVNGVQQFTTVGQTAAHNTGSKLDYQWLDATPINGNNFYRIKTVDLDGKISYSIILKVSLNHSGKDISIYPNPVQKGYVSFQSSDLQKGTYTLKIFNSNGQEVYKQEFVHEGGAISQTISLPGRVKPGMYNLQLKNGNDVTNKTFIVQ
jgi:type IX secretion system substrate protein